MNKMTTPFIVRLLILWRSPLLVAHASSHIVSGVLGLPHRHAKRHTSHAISSVYGIRDLLAPFRFPLPHAAKHSTLMNSFPMFRCLGAVLLSTLPYARAGPAGILCTAHSTSLSSPRCSIEKRARWPLSRSRCAAPAQARSTKQASAQGASPNTGSSPRMSIFSWSLDDALHAERR